MHYRRARAVLVLLFLALLTPGALAAGDAPGGFGHVYPAPDPSDPRPKEEQEAIWRAFEALVAHAGKNFEVVTSDDLLNSATSNGFMPPPAGMPILLRQPGQ